MLAAAAVTLLAGLAIAFGVHRFVAAYLLNIWFIIALALVSSFHHAAHISYTWAQVLAAQIIRRSMSRVPRESRSKIRSYTC